MSKICTHCNGDKGWYNTSGDWVECQECFGLGEIYDDEESGQGILSFL